MDKQMSSWLNVGGCMCWLCMVCKAAICCVAQSGSQAASPHEDLNLYPTECASTLRNSKKAAKIHKKKYPHDLVNAGKTKVFCVFYCRLFGAGIGNTSATINICPQNAES